MEHVSDSFHLGFKLFIDCSEGVNQIKKDSTQFYFTFSEKEGLNEFKLKAKWGVYNTLLKLVRFDGLDPQIFV